MYLVVFRSRKRADMDAAAYAADAAEMERAAAAMPGYLSFKSYTAADGQTAAISEWTDEAAARGWGRHAEHRLIQAKGRSDYYAGYTLFAAGDLRIHRFGEQG